MKNSSSIGAQIATGTMTVALGALALTGVASAQTTATANTQSHGSWGGGSGQQRAPGVFGTVASVSGDTITVTSKGYGQSATPTTYTVNATSATVTKDGSSSAVSSIAVGDNVMVQGTVSGDNVTATKIEDGMTMGGGAGMMGGRGVFGTVASISGTTLTITSKAMGGPNSTTSSTPTTYTVNAANATVTKDGSSSSFSSIAVGDTVIVQGTVSGTTVTATKINDGVVPGAGGMGKGTAPTIAGNGEPVVGGTITTVSGNSITITNKSNVTYTIDATNATVEKGNATSSVSSLAIGDNVIVQGSVNGNAVTASSVIDSGAAPASANSSTSGGSKGFMGGLFGGIGSFIHNLFGFF